LLLHTLLLNTSYSEIARLGEDLSLPEFCHIEYPDHSGSDEVTSKKYKRFILNVNPKEGLYAGGNFQLEFDLNQVPEYPDKPPKVSMLTKMWHVNVNNSSICHNYLKVSISNEEGYTPVLGLQGVINGLIALFFGLENADDPLNLEAAKLYQKDHPSYCKIAKEWTQKYASKHC